MSGLVHLVAFDRQKADVKYKNSGKSGKLFCHTFKGNLYLISFLFGIFIETYFELNFSESTVNSKRNKTLLLITSTVA